MPVQLIIEFPHKKNLPAMNEDGNGPGAGIDYRSEPHINP